LPHLKLEDESIERTALELRPATCELRWISGAKRLILMRDMWLY
jgi:hypothetical protein